MRRIRLTGPRGLELDVEVPTARAERMRGLLGRDDLAPGHALLLRRTRSVHTFGMRFELAVALLDGHLRVLAVRRLRPGHVLFPRRSVRHVLELQPDADVRPGDRLRVVFRAQAGQPPRPAAPSTIH